MTEQDRMPPKMRASVDGLLDHLVATMVEPVLPPGYSDPTGQDPIGADEQGRRPVQIGVFCDRCGITDERDYLCSGVEGREARFGYARDYLTEHEGWRCDEDGDFCPACVATFRAEANAALASLAAQSPVPAEPRVWRLYDKTNPPTPGQDEIGLRITDRNGHVWLHERWTGTWGWWCSADAEIPDDGSLPGGWRFEGLLANNGPLTEESEGDGP